MRKRSAISIALGARPRCVPLLVAMQLGRRRQSRQPGFRPDREGPLSRDRGRLRRLPHRARTAASRSPAAAPIETPFGNIAAPNITPDRETGIGAWSDDAVRRRRVRKGIRPDGARLYPGDAVHRPTPRCRATTCWRSAPISTRSSRCAIRSSPTRCRSRSTSAPRCGSGTALYFTAGEFKPDPQQVGGMESRRLPGARARPLRRLPHAEVVPRRRQDQRISARLATCRAGSRPTSPTTAGAASAAGRSDDIVGLSEDRP